MSYQYILFDLDGTVTDPGIGITKSVAYALEYFGIKATDTNTLYKFIGPPLTESFQEYYNLNDNEVKVAIQKYREYFSDKGIYENEVYPGMISMLENLKNNGKTVILATSKPTFYAEKILKFFELYRYFDYVAGNDLDLKSTKGDVIKYALEQNGVIDNRKAIMVGDRKHDILGAKSNKITSAGVLYGYGGREELAAAGADYIVETVAELEALLNNNRVD